MYDVSKVKKEYLEDLKDEYEYWKEIDEQHKKGLNAATIGYDKMNQVADKINNFDESFAKMVEQETQDLVKGITTRVSEGVNAYGGVVARRDDGTYTRLGLNSSDPILSSYVNYVESTNGCVTFSKNEEFVDSICNQFGVIRKKDNELELMLNEGQTELTHDAINKGK